MHVCLMADLADHSIARESATLAGHLVLSNHQVTLLSLSKQEFRHLDWLPEKVELQQPFSGPLVKQVHWLQHFVFRFRVDCIHVLIGNTARAHLPLILLTSLLQNGRSISPQVVLTLKKNPRGLQRPLLQLADKVIVTTRILQNHLASNSLVSRTFLLPSFAQQLQRVPSPKPSVVMVGSPSDYEDWDSHLIEIGLVAQAISDVNWIWLDSEAELTDRARFDAVNTIQRQARHATVQILSGADRLTQEKAVAAAHLVCASGLRVTCPDWEEVARLCLHNQIPVMVNELQLSMLGPDSLKSSQLVVPRLPGYLSRAMIELLQNPARLNEQWQNLSAASQIQPDSHINKLIRIYTGQPI